MSKARVYQESAREMKGVGSRSETSIASATSISHREICTTAPAQMNASADAAYKTKKEGTSESFHVPWTKAYET
jgi:hypothetical protein